MTGEKKGYGAAVIRGIDYSIKKLGAEIVITKVDPIVNTVKRQILD